MFETIKQNIQKYALLRAAVYIIWLYNLWD